MKKRNYLFYQPLANVRGMNEELLADLDVLKRACAKMFVFR